VIGDRGLIRANKTLSKLNQDGRGQDAALGQVFQHFGLTVESIQANSEPGSHCYGRDSSGHDDDEGRVAT
jgi:hypothetical protein